MNVSAAPLGFRVTRLLSVFCHLPKMGVRAAECAVLAFLCANAHAQTAHFSGAQITVPTSALNDNYGIAVDGSGNVYVADSGHGRVLKETLSGGGYTESTIGSGLYFPASVAVDMSGNVYIADTDNNRVLKETLSGGNYTQTTIGSGFSVPYGVAVDGGGNVYVADSGHGLVLKETLTGGSYTQSTIASGLSEPTGIAVDGSGNIYVATPNVNQVLKETLSGGGYTQSTIGSGLLAPDGVAVDGNNNVYIADTGNSRVLKETLSGGSYTQATVGQGLYGPIGVAVDARGDVYIDDTFNSRVLEEAPAGTFGTVNVGSSSSAISLIFTFDTAGTIGKPAVLTQGALGLDFSDAGTGSCTSSGTVYSVGNTCTVNVMFTPKLSGDRHGAAILQDGSGNSLATGYIYGSGLAPQVNFLPGTPSTVVPSGVQPAGITVDANENVYIADAVHQQVLKETLSAGSYTQSTVASNLSNPTWGAALDGSGSVYVTVPSANQVLKETPLGGTYTQSILAFSGLSNPHGIALDGSGNIYIADTNNNRVLKETLSGGSYIESTIASSGLSSPYGVAADGSGNVYIADTNNNRVLKETLSGGSYTESTIASSGLTNPWGVAVGGSGNVYISDTNNNRVLKEDFADPPTLSFATTTFGSTSTDSPKTVTVENIGNAVLTFPIPGTGTNPSIATGFALASSGSSDCQLVGSSSPTAGTLAAGSSCLLPISFTPAAVGALSGSLVLTDNNLNAAAPGYTMQSIPLSGTSTQATPVLGFTPIATQVFGAAPFAVNASSASAGGVAYAVVSGPATVSGNMITLTGTGTVVLSANQTPTAYYAGATTTTSFTVVAPFTLTSATSSGSSAGSASVAPGAVASFSFTLTPGIGGTFLDAIAFSATGLPAGATATFSPTTIAAGAAATSVTLSIQTANGQTASNEEPLKNRPVGPVALGFLLLPLLSMKAVRKRLRQMPRLSMMLAATGLSLGAVLGLSGCAGGSASPQSSTPTAQSYTVVVIAKDVSTGVQGTTNFTLTVQ